MAEHGNGHEAKDKVRVGSPVDLREKILAAKDSHSERVFVAEWDVEVEIRSMTGEERARTLEKYIDLDSGKVNFEAMTPEIIIASTWDPTTGEKVFKPGDAGMLNKKSAGALERLGQVALRLSGLSERAKEAAGKAS